MHKPGLALIFCRSQAVRNKITSLRLVSFSLRKLSQVNFTKKPRDLDDGQLPDLAEIALSDFSDAGFSSCSDVEDSESIPGERVSRRRKPPPALGEEGLGAVKTMHTKLGVSSRAEIMRKQREAKIREKTSLPERKLEREALEISKLTQELLPIVSKLKKGTVTPLELMKTLIKLKEENHIQPAWTLFKVMLQYKAANILHFNLLLGFYVQRKEVSKANRLFSKLEGYQLKPSISTFNTMMKGWGITGDLDRAFQLLDQMVIRENLSPDIQTYNILINCCAKLAQNDRAMNLYETMLKSEDISPDVVTFSALIESAGAVKDLDKAFEHYNDMLKRGIAPDVKAVGVLVDACKKAGNVKRAFEVLKLAQVQGLEPNLVVYNTLLDVCAKSFSLGRAIKIFNIMAEQKIQPDEITFNCLLDACRSHQKVKKAWEIWESMGDYQVTPSLLTFQMMEACCREAQDWTALKRVKQLRANAEKLPKVFVHKAWFYKNGQEYKVMNGVKARKGWFNGARHAKDLYYYLKGQTKYRPILSALPAEAIETMSAKQKMQSLLYHCEKKALASQKGRERPFVITNASMCADCQSYFLYTSLFWDKEIICQDQNKTRVWRNGFLIS